MLKKHKVIYSIMKGLATLISGINNVRQRIPSLDICTFEEKDIEKMINIVSKHRDDKTLLERYRNGKLQCSSCKKIISSEKANLGAVIPTTRGKLKLICKDFRCYEKSLT